VLGCFEIPPSLSRPTAAFAPQLLLPTCRAISASPPPRGSRSTRTWPLPNSPRAVRSAAGFRPLPSPRRPPASITRDPPAHQLGRDLSSPSENTTTRCTPPPCTCATHSSAYRARQARAPTLLLRPPSVRTLLLPTEPAPPGLARPRREPLARLPARPPLHLRALARATATPSLAPCVRAPAEPPHRALAHALLRVAHAYCRVRSAQYLLARVSPTPTRQPLASA
jgi:hypothetical protein